ncbi:nucleoside triphosphate pyrophosphatase [Pontiella sp.]|uniref:Maf family protein n=1 Tax=Pontiella sp. TaxID=2837462 RepID=UPI00356A5601
MQNYPNIGKLILASASPRRRELLASLGLDFTVQVPQIDETPHPDEAPRRFAERMAAEKASAIDASPDTVLIAADTIVVQGNSILGKPKNEQHACAMLSHLSGQKHEVITGVCVKRNDRTEIFSVSTEVVFRELGAGEIDRYVATGCPMDKAGAYAIQGGAAHMVRSICGSYTNIVGLPLCELHEALISFDSGPEIAYS